MFVGLISCMINQIVIIQLLLLLRLKVILLGSNNSPSSLWATAFTMRSPVAALDKQGGLRPAHERRSQYTLADSEPSTVKPGRNSGEIRRFHIAVTQFDCAPKSWQRTEASH